MREKQASAVRATSFAIIKLKILLHIAPEYGNIKVDGVCKTNPEEMCIRMSDFNVLPLRELPGGFIGTEFGKRLFGKLYAAASAYVIQAPNGEGELGLLDTAFAREALKRPWPDGAEFGLYSNHPEGDMSPTEDDLENLALMPTGTRLYIVCEDDCIEWERAR